MSIAAAESAGFFRDVEPFTESGRSIYPSGFYAIVGLVSKLGNIPTASALNLVFFTVSLFLIFFLTQTVQDAFKSQISGFAVLTPLLLGTLNTLTTGDWSLQLDGHAVIWPMMAGLYSANAESLGLILVSLMVILLYQVRLRPCVGRLDKRLIWSAVIIGLLANSHTYAFFLGVTIAVVVLLDHALTSSGNKSGASPSVSRATQIIMLVVLVLIMCEILSIQPLSRLLLLWVVGFSYLGALNNRNQKHQLVFFVLTAVFVAFPQLIKMADAIIENDSFLALRQQTSESLSVPPVDLLVYHLPLSFLVSISYVVAYRNRSRLQLRMISLLYFVWLSLSLNQLWGLSQEPYRFAINSQIPLVIFCTASLISGLRTAINTRILKSFTYFGLALIVFVSALEVRGFWNYRKNVGVIQLNSSKYLELSSAASFASTGLILPDPCIDPSVLKVVSRKKVAAYSKGLAWPDSVDSMRALMESRVNNVLDLTSAKKIGVESILVDNQCPAEWSKKYSSNLKAITFNEKNRFQLFKLQFE